MEKPAPTLTQLVGLPLKISRHAANMLVLHFGSICRSVGKHGPESYGDLALHVQCPWRVRAADKLLFGSADRWRPGSFGRCPSRGRLALSGRPSIRDPPRGRGASDSQRETLI